MAITEIPVVQTVRAITTYRCSCPICGTEIPITDFQFFSQLQSNGSLKQCPECSLCFFVMNPEIEPNVNVSEVN